MKKQTAFVMALLLTVNLAVTGPPMAAYAAGTGTQLYEKLKFFGADAKDSDLDPWGERPTQEQFSDYNNIEAFRSVGYVINKGGGTFIYPQSIAKETQVLRKAAEKQGNVELQMAGVVTATDTVGTMSTGSYYSSGTKELQKSMLGKNDQFIRLSQWYDMRELEQSFWGYILEDMPLKKDWGGWPDGWVEVRDGEIPQWTDCFVMLRDLKPPKASSISYVSGGNQLGGGIIGRKSQIQVRVTFDEPVDPDSAKNLQILLGGKVAENLAGAVLVDGSEFMQYEYTLIVPDGIVGDSVVFWNQDVNDASKTVRDYFGKNSMENSTTTYSMKGATFDTRTPAMQSVAVQNMYYQDMPRYYCWQSGFSMPSMFGDQYRNIYIKLNLDPLEVYPQGLKAAVYEPGADGVHRTDIIKQRAVFELVKGSEGLYRLQANRAHENGILDLCTTSSPYPVQEGDEVRYYQDLRGAILTASAVEIQGSEQWGSSTDSEEDGRRFWYDYNSTEAIESFRTKAGGALGIESFRTAVSAEPIEDHTGATVYETFLPRQIVRNQPTTLEVLAEPVGDTTAKGYARSWEFFTRAGDENVFWPDIQTLLLLGQGRESSEELRSHRGIVFLNIERNGTSGTQLQDLSGNPIYPRIREGVNPKGYWYTAETAVNVGDDTAMSKMKMVPQDGEYVEKTVELMASGRDINGMQIESKSVTLKVDTRAPEVSARQGQDIAPEADGTGEQAVSWLIEAQDTNEVDGVYYRYVPAGTEAENVDWLKASPAENTSGQGLWAAPMTIPAQSTYVGTLQYYAVDELGNSSLDQVGIKEQAVVCNNLRPVSAGAITIERYENQDVVGENDGPFTEVSVLLGEELRGYNISYSWRNLTLGGTGHLRKYNIDTDPAIGSKEDQRSWAGYVPSSVRTELFNHLYRLDILIEAPTAQGTGSALRASFDFDFCTEAPKVKWGNRLPADLYGSGQIALELSSAADAAGYWEIRRPGLASDSAVYDGPMVEMGGDITDEEFRAGRILIDPENPPTPGNGALATGYYELYVEADNSVGKTSRVFGPFLYNNPQDSWDFSIENIRLSESSGLLKGDTLLDGNLIFEREIDGSLMADIQYARDFHNFDQYPSASLGTVQIAVQKGTDSGIYMPEQSFSISNNPDSGRLEGSAEGVLICPVGEDGKIGIALKLNGDLVSGGYTTAPAVRATAHYMETYPPRLVEKASAAGAAEYEFISTDPYQMVGVATLAALRVTEVLQGRGEAMAYDEIIYDPASGVSDDQLSNYVEIQSAGGLITGIKIKKNCTVTMTPVWGAPTAAGWSELGAAEPEVITVEHLPKQAPDNLAETVAGDSEGQEAAYRENNQQWIWITGGNYIHHNDPVESTGFKGGGKGYGRNGFEFYSSVYPIVDFALMAPSEGLNGSDVPDRNGNGRLDAADLEAFSTSQADINRFQTYLNEDRLTLNRRVVNVTYRQGTVSTVGAFVQAKEGYHIELKDCSKAPVFWVNVKLQTPQGMIWVPVVASYTPVKDDINSFNVRNVNSVQETGKLVPMIVFDENQAAVSQEAKGIMSMAHAVLPVDWEVVSEFISPTISAAAFDALQWDDPERYNSMMSKVREYVSGASNDRFSHEQELSFTPGKEFNLLYTDYQGKTLSRYQFSSEDYNITYPAISTRVDYYIDYSKKTSWNGEGWISMYEAGQEGTVKDLAIEIQPGEGEAEFYYFEDQAGLTAKIDGQGSGEAGRSDIQSDTSGRLQALADAGIKIYKKLLLRPDTDNPLDPFGRGAQAKAVNVTLNQERVIPLDFKVQGVGPTISVRMLTGSALGSVVSPGSWALAVSAGDSGSGMSRFEVWVNEEQQGQAEGLAENAYYRVFPADAAVRLTVRAENNAGLVSQSEGVYGEGILDPTAPGPKKGIDYKISYQYEDTEGEMKSVVPGLNYGVVFAKVDLLTSGTSIQNNGGSQVHAFLPGQSSSFVFALEKGGDVTSETAIYNQPSLEEFVLADYEPKTPEAAQANITLRVLASDLKADGFSLKGSQGGEITLTDKGMVPLNGKSYREMTASVTKNDVYTFTVKKGEYQLHTGTLLIGNIAGGGIAPLELTLTYSSSPEAITRNPVIVRAATNQPAVVTVLSSEGGVKRLSGNRFQFSTNGRVDIVASTAAWQVAKTVELTNIDVTPPQVRADVSYTSEAALVTFSLDGGTDPLSEITLDSFRQLEAGFVGGSADTGTTLDRIQAVRIRKNGVYRFIVSDLAGNTQIIDQKISGLTSTLPTVTDVAWLYQATGTSAGAVSGNKAPVNRYVEILTRDGNPPTNEDIKLTITTNLPVKEVGKKGSDYATTFEKTLPGNVTQNFVFEDPRTNATNLLFKTDVIDKGFPVITFQNAQTLSYFERNKEAYSKKDLYDFTVGDFKGGVYTTMSASRVSIDFGEFDPNALANNVFDMKNPYVVTYSAVDDSGNKTEVARTIRLFGKDDMCVLVNGKLPEGDRAEIFGQTLTVSVENYSGQLFASLVQGRYTASEMKRKGQPMTLSADKKSFTQQVTARKWYTVQVRTGTMESFTIQIWVN